MSLPIIIPVISSTIFGIATLIFYFRQQGVKRELIGKDHKQSQRLYELAVMKEIQDKTGYSLDLNKVIEVITGGMHNLISYSTVSSLILKNNMFSFSTYAQESVSNAFVEQVKESAIASFNKLANEPTPISIAQSISGVILDDSNIHTLSSYFHMPLIFNDQIVGIITVASTKFALYKEEDMSLLYSITNQSMKSLEKIQSVLDTEKQKLMAMIGSLVDGVFMVDVNSQLTVINNAAKDFLQIKKPHPTIIDVLTCLPNIYDFRSMIEHAIIDDKMVSEKEVPLGEKFFQVFITPVHYAHDRSGMEGKPIVLGASILLHEITLEKSIAQMKEDFTNIIVHELRSPLTAIKAATELIVMPGSKLQEEDKTKMLMLIKDQSNKLLDEIGLILDAAKLESGMFKIQKTPNDLKSLLEEKVTFFQAEANNKNISLTASIEDLPTTLLFDQRYISQVINNLLSNSLKFTSFGGKITISAHRENKEIVVSVGDTGVGIPKDKQASLFSKFTQIRQPGAHVGTGLGLYIVKGIIEAHGGSILLESETNLGTTITFRLPAELPSPIPSHSQASIPTQHFMIN